MSFLASAMAVLLPLPLLPGALEGPALRQREIAAPGPAGVERKPARRAAGSEACGQCRQAVIEPRPARDPAPQPQRPALRPADDAALELQVAQPPQQSGQRNLDRADVLAAAVQGAGVGQVLGAVEPDELRR